MKRRLLSIGTKYDIPGITVDTVRYDEFIRCDITSYDAVVVSGGDGAIRRCVETMHTKGIQLPIIIDPKGSFNVIAKQHRLPDARKTIEAYLQGNFDKIRRCYYTLNDKHVFLFSAGNMGDLHHIFISETLRFGILKNGAAKYLLSFVLMLPLHIVLTPPMLLSKRRFFIFTPLKFLPKRFGSFRRDIDLLHIDTGNDYHFVELDGDIVTLHTSELDLKKAGTIEILKPKKII
jgi:hypothetical protein